MPTEQIVETKDGQKVQIEKRMLPGYVLVNMDLSDEAWTGEGHPGRHRLRRRRGEARAAHPRSRSTGCSTPPGRRRGPPSKSQAEFTLGESVKVIAGPLSDFDGEIVEINPEQQKLKVLVDIFERQMPVELAFDQVKKLD